MTSNDEPTPTSPTAPTRRRSSLVELFASRPNLDTGSTAPRQQASAMAQAQEQSRQRRLSITTLGLSGSPTHTQQTSPFGTLRKGKSMSMERSSGSAIDDNENAIDEGDSVPPMSPGRAPQSPQMARRVSSGGYDKARSGSIVEMSGGGGGAPYGNTDGAAGVNGSTPPSAKGASPPGMRRSGEGFSWAENFRNRAQRASISAASGPPSGITPLSGIGGHSRSKSQAVPEPAPAEPPAPPTPKNKAPDHFQERILKGDFYMD